MQWVLNSNFTALFLTCKIESANKEEEERGGPSDDGWQFNLKFSKKNISEN